MFDPETPGPSGAFAISSLKWDIAIAFIAMIFQVDQIFAS